jgi:hypothetical protein
VHSRSINVTPRHRWPWLVERKGMGWMDADPVAGVNGVRVEMGAEGAEGVSFG